MHVICTAIVDNPMQRDNLCQCVEIIGGVPAVARDTVCVEYTGDNQKAEKLIELFEHYCRHEILILSGG